MSNFDSLGGSGNGYDGYSMSNNARGAYANGEMPKSKWTKTTIIDAVKEISPEKAEMLSKVKLPVLKEYALHETGWHHTSEYFNRTFFYAVDEDFVENLTPERAKELENYEIEEKDSSAKVYRGDFKYIVWSGSKAHPKATEIELKDVLIEEQGSFYKVYDAKGELAVRKKIGSNGTSVVNYEERDRKNAENAYYEQQRIANSTDEANAFYEAHKGNFERSQSGTLYLSGRKPSQWDYEDGLDKFFKVGEHRLARNKNTILPAEMSPIDTIHYMNSGAGGFVLETWTGKEWTENKLQTFYCLKTYNHAYVGENEINIDKRFGIEIKAETKPEDYSEDWEEGQICYEYFNTLSELQEREKEINDFNDNLKGEQKKIKNTSNNLSVTVTNIQQDAPVIEESQPKKHRLHR